MVAQPQSHQKIPLEPWEIGGELLDILSRGLYSNAKDAVREYVQNSVDANASAVYVTVRGPRVTIRDDGEGMDWDTLRRARRFGASDKSPRGNVGYRGIGMYAAFGMCESMQITTRQSDADELLRLRIDFGEMRRTLEQDRAAIERMEIGLTDLLYEYTQFSREPDETGSHFTIVRLDGITQEYRAQVHDLSSLSTYLLNTLPLAFPESGYGARVNNWLGEHVGLNPVRLMLRVGDEPEHPIEPQLAEDVGDPQYEWVKDAQDRNIAFIWHALTTRGERIPSNGVDEALGVSGYLLKLKGFTLGDRVRLKHLWPAAGGRTVYHHYTGEVHLLEDAEVYPNAARDNLESSLSKQVLERCLGEHFYRLHYQADLSREIVRIKRRTQGINEILSSLQGRTAKADEDPFELYHESMNLLDALERLERDVSRLRRGKGRGKRAVEPSVDQQNALGQLNDEIEAAQTSTRKISDATGQRTEGGDLPSRRSAPEVRPQVTLLNRATEAVRVANENASSDQLQRALRSLSEARRSRSLVRAVGILDELKAGGTEFSDDMEASRKEIRTFLGLSPMGPVSLIEALAESGFLLANEREQALIQAIDHGILIGIGGRGERYEAILRTASESVSEHDNLQ